MQDDNLKTPDKIPVGISSCLLGEEVRYDGGHKSNPYIVGTLSQYFDFIPFCPEVDIGLGIPREPIHLVLEQDQTRCVGTRSADLDVTAKLSDSADAQLVWQSDIFGYILKKGSPSCGMERVKLLHNRHAERTDVGIFAGRMMRNLPLLPVEEEGRLGDPILRENFIQRVFVYQRWSQICSADLSWATLTEFHARHKLILMSHDQTRTKELGRKLSESASLDIDEYAQSYIADMMTILKIKATRGNHVNVLQHIQGYLKKQLDSDDKQELSHSIEQYRLGLLPLIVPITLLRHHFMKYPDEYIQHSYYMCPYPNELMLLNCL